MATAKQPATVTNSINEKAVIKALIDDFNAALCAKDLKRMLSFYASNMIAYDVKPPFQTKGAIALKHTWEASFPYFPDSFSIEVSELNIFAGTDHAFAHYFFRLHTKNKSHDAAQTWLRATVCYKKLQGKWKIVHEHGSVPFNPHTLQAQFTLKP